MPSIRLPIQISRSLVLAACLMLPGMLGGCAAVAVSLAGAGAGAGITHQVNGQASRTFSAPLSRVDDAARLASRKMQLEINQVATIDGDQVTKATVSGLDITVDMQTLSPTLTRVDVVARKNFFLVDGATAQEIVTQIERALDAIAIQEEATAAAEASARKAAARSNDLAPANNRKSTAKRKSAI